jgi:hypothetical protein
MHNVKQPRLFDSGPSHRSIADRFFLVIRVYEKNMGYNQRTKRGGKASVALVRVCNLSICFVTACADIPFDSGLGHNLSDRNRVFIFILLYLPLVYSRGLRSAVETPGFRSGEVHR